MMPYRQILITSLQVNRANDRHGELQNESMAIAWLFNNREQHMKNLAKDIVTKGEILEPPLVYQDGQEFIVYDGNRRVTSLKLLRNPQSAPTTELQTYFSDLTSSWSGPFPEKVLCRVETDRDRIDDILYRRHTGTQSGIGQSTWDDRMKKNFIDRTGKSTGINIADEIENLLEAAGMLPLRGRIPRSTLNRLFSSEAFRNRAGISVQNKKLKITHEPKSVLKTLRRIAQDLSSKKIVLGDLWDVEGKMSYLDALETEGFLPTAAELNQKNANNNTSSKTTNSSRTRVKKQKARTTLISKEVDYGVAWPARLQRTSSIWAELQYDLEISRHPNAIAVLLRVLIELSVKNYISQSEINSVHENDKLGNRITKVAEDLFERGKIDKKYLGEIRKLQNQDRILSTDTLNRYVHSANFSPSPEHLTAIWDSLALFVVLCLNA